MAKQARLETTESAAVLEKHLREILYIRHFEEKCNQVFRQGKAGGYLHVAIGMEATAIGFTEAIRVGWDNVIAAYRIHALPLLMGTDPIAVMSEIMGREGGMSRGKGGSMHLYDAERRFFGGWGIVGGHTPLGAGLALAAKYLQEDRVTLCFLGDGAANAGVFFETLNMAGLWDLPVVFIIENNEFAMGTRLEYHAADTELWKRGLPFAIESERIDGMDVEKTKVDAKRIVDWVRTHQKPFVVEVMNYRYAGHGAADNDQKLYRTPEEVEKHKSRDPLLKVKRDLIENNFMSEEKIEAIDEEILQQVEVILEAADQSPHPSKPEVYDNVYVSMQVERGH